MKLAAVAGIAALVAGVAVLAFQPFQRTYDVRTPLDVVGAFAYQMDHGNFGKACGLMSQKYRESASVQPCADGLTFNAGINLGFWGVDIFDGLHVVPNSHKVNKDGSESYAIESKVVPATRVTVAKQANGRYRIVKIG